MAGLPRFYKFDEPTAGEIRRAKVLAVGGQRPRCKKGKACSAACIDPGESCLVEFPDPASVGLGKLSNKIEQLSLFDTSKYYSKDYIQGLKSEKEIKRLNISEGIKDRGDYRGEYDKLRQDAIDFNRSLSDRGLDKVVKPLKVPVTWEVRKAIQERFKSVEDKMVARLQKASKERNKEKYDRLENKLIELYEKVGSRAGARNPIPVKGWFWEKDKVEEKLPSLKPLNTSKQFEDRDKKTDGLSKKMEQLSLEVAKLLGTTNRGYVDFDELYRNENEKDSYDRLRVALIRGGKIASFSDAVVALEEYSLSSKTAREMRISQRPGYDGPVKYERMASDLDNLLRWNQLPTPPIEKYRGFRATPERLQEMVESAGLKEKFKHDTIYSWSSSLGQGAGFSDSRLDGFPERTESIIFRAVNRRGVPIEYVTENQGEYEMLTPSKVNYQYLAYRPIEIGSATYHIFDVKEF